MAIKLQGPVGDLSKTSKKGNLPADVKYVKGAFTALGILSEEDNSAEATQTLIAAIKTLQGVCGITADGRIDPGGGTLTKLNDLTEGKTIIVNLHRQVLDAYNKSSRTYHFNCASGDSSHPTPPGYYKIQRKEKVYRSKTYDAQMNYAMFFHRGYAIHMAHAVGITSYLKTWGFDSMGSHGCVRLPEDNAAALFNWAQIGTYVVILPRN